MKDVKAVFIDLDGTLVHDGVISTDDWKAIEEVVTKGIPVIPATTRMRFSAHRLIKNLPLTEFPMICLNGAMVLGPGWNNVDNLCSWLLERLDMDSAVKISEYADIKGYEITTIFGERKYWKKRRDLPIIRQDENPIAHIIENNSDALNYGAPVSYMMHTEKNGFSGIEDMEGFAMDKLKKTTCLHRHHRSKELKALTIYPKGTSKRKGMKLVCDRMGIHTDEVIAIGDDEVDIEMLKTAGIGIAMGNSSDHVKEIADYVAPSCEEGGVAHALKEYLFL